MSAHVEKTWSVTMPDLLDRIKVEIRERMRTLRPAVHEVKVLERTLSAMEEADRPVATARQRARKARSRATHNGSTHKPNHTIRYLTNEQVAEMRVEARRKKIGLPRLMQRYGYVQTDNGWRQQ
jgi:hypothetical protein